MKLTNEPLWVDCLFGISRIIVYDVVVTTLVIVLCNFSFARSARTVASTLLDVGSCDALVLRTGSGLACLDRDQRYDRI